MANETIFTKIIHHQIPSDIVYQDESVTAFRDIHPKAPVHILIVPNTIIPTVNEVTADDEKVLGHLFVVASQLAKKEGISHNGYRLIVNCNKHAGQIVFHLHMHLLGGKELGPMISEVE
ncbi:MAG: HIT domain-containing protein [Chitinivibrionales bacterium]|nr:HIT domain-containing protein [Chitinivibrionales bacterium]